MRCIRWSSISSTWFSRQRHLRYRATRTSRICRRTRISRVPKFNFRPAIPTTDQDNSPAGSRNRDTGDLEQLGYLEPTGELGYPGFPSLTLDRLVQVQTQIYSPAGPMDRDIRDTEQLEYRYRPITPGEEETMRIYVDGIYRPPDLIEKPGEVYR